MSVNMIHYELNLGVYETPEKAKYAVHKWWKEHPEAKYLEANVEEFYPFYKVTIRYKEVMQCPEE